MQPRADELSVRLEWHPASEIPSACFDPEGIHRAVLNIVTNAIDAAEGRSDAQVSVSTSWNPQSALARISVRDNGSGIAEEDRESIFQFFASTKGARGTGLGLPVSQKIVREHGGRILVNSTVGQGSEFAIELPMRKPDGRGTGDVPVYTE
jgi:signal transduction histidine kinase